MSSSYLVVVSLAILALTSIHAEDEPASLRSPNDSPQSGYFQYVNVPSPFEYEFGFNVGNTDHFISRFEQLKNTAFRTMVKWSDSEEGYGQHVFEYNHGDSDESDYSYQSTPKYSAYSTTRVPYQPEQQPPVKNYNEDLYKPEQRPPVKNYNDDLFKPEKRPPVKNYNEDLFKPEKRPPVKNYNEDLYKPEQRLPVKNYNDDLFKPEQRPPVKNYNEDDYPVLSAYGGAPVQRSVTTTAAPIKVISTPPAPSKLLIQPKFNAPAFIKYEHQRPENQGSKRPTNGNKRIPRILVDNNP